MRKKNNRLTALTVKAAHQTLDNPNYTTFFPDYCNSPPHHKFEPHNQNEICSGVAR